MKSGVYCLTFKDGSQYVGKSVDIERRWKEHADKMRVGKASGPMQIAYDKYGYPTAKVLVICHSDHIDLMETYYICRLQPQLNSVGGIAVTNEDLLVLEQYPDLLMESTADHLMLIVKLRAEMNKLHNKYTGLKEFLDAEKLESALGEELYNVSYKLQETESANETAMQRIAKLEYELNKPWWKRIFS